MEYSFVSHHFKLVEVLKLKQLRQTVHSSDSQQVNIKTRLNNVENIIRHNKQDYFVA